MSGKCFRRVCGPAVALGLLLASCAPQLQTSPPAEPFFFIQMTDPQFGMFANDSSFARETELFQRAIDHANRLTPAFVVITGDLVNKPGDRAQIEELLRIAGQLHPAIPLYWVAGNHDVANVPSQTSLQHYRTTFGQDWYQFQLSGWRFLVLNSTIIHRPDRSAYERDVQWKWLSHTLIENGAPPTIIFQHHPLFIKDPKEPQGYENLAAVDRARYLHFFKTHNVKAVLAGHYHRNSYGRIGDLEMITSGPVGKPLGGGVSGFRIVKVYPDHIEHKYYGLDAVP